MLLLFLVFCAAVVAVPLAGGDLRKLARIRFAHAWLLGLALTVQVLLVVWAGSATPLRVGLLVGSYLAGMAFLVANRRIPGVWLIAVGAGLNLVVIALNHGVMPASPHALVSAGLPAHDPTFANSAALRHPILPFLGDVFAIPASWPLANVFSIGDLCILAGAGFGVHRMCGSRLVRFIPTRSPAPGMGDVSYREGEPQVSRPVTRKPESRTL
jgi:hypothetical protein